MRQSWFIKTENGYIGWDLTEVKDLSDAHTWTTSKKAMNALSVILLPSYINIQPTIGRYEPKEI